MQIIVGQSRERVWVFVILFSCILTSLWITLYYGELFGSLWFLCELLSWGIVNNVNSNRQQLRKRTRTDHIPDVSVPPKRVSNIPKSKTVEIEGENKSDKEPNLGKSNEESNIDTGSSDGDYLEFDEILKRKQLLKAGIKVQRDLSNIILSKPCKICRNQWFDLRIGPRSGLCDRCATEKKKYISRLFVILFNHFAL